MAAVRAEAGIQRAFGKGSLPLESASDVLTYLKSPPSSPREAQEPARKKQRKTESLPIAAPIMKEAHTITLARVDLQLHFENESSSFNTINAWDLAEDVAVNLESVRSVGGLRQSSGLRYEISLRFPTSKNTVELQLTSNCLHSAFSHLERIIELQSMPVVGKTQEAPIAWAGCKLEASAEGELLLRGEIFWAAERTYLESKNAAVYTDILRTYLPCDIPENAALWSPQDFYENVHVPDADMETASYLQGDFMESKLYPFQQRAVGWLLKREGAEFAGGLLIAQPPVQSAGKDVPSSFYTGTDLDGNNCYVSHIHGVVVKDSWALLDYSPELRGGILAEEMGLGKTVELIALTCLHKRPYTCPVSQGGITSSSATLIITPQHILQQWKNEIATHAPNLRVLHYTGLSSEGKKEDLSYSIERLARHDIVLTTYNVLAREIYYADTPPARNLRHAQRYERRRSPLVLINWWRVCLDEAQMIESGVSQAAKVARLIPRVNAWAVSGTPLKKNVDDLFGLLIFLRYEPYCSSKKTWSRVDKATFKSIFGQIALRHTKHKVAHELRLPAQKRMVITMPFTAVEEQNYNTLFNQMCHFVGLNLNGSPIRDDWDPNADHIIEKMRSWLRRLRETCLHPQVGTRNRKALGRGQGPLRTVGEVLEVMIEGNETELRLEERKLALAQVLRAHIFANEKSNQNRSQKALQIYQDALKDAEAFVESCRQDLAAEKARVAANPDLMEATPAPDESTYETDAEGKDKEPSGRLATLRKQLRSALEVLHVCNFFVATSYFQIKENEELIEKDSAGFKALENLETKHYDIAKLLRKEMLQDSHKKASLSMRKISHKKNGFSQLPDLPLMEQLGGIENRKLLEKMDEVASLMDQQSVRIREWRAKIIECLLQPLVDEDADDQEKTGDEYEDSTKLQDELYVYTLALRAIIADRHRAITGQENLLVDNEVKTVIRQAKDGTGHAPDLVLKIMAIRNQLKPKKDEGSLRGMVAEFRSLHTSLQWQADGGSNRSEAELRIVEKQMKQAQKIATKQTESLAELEREQELFRKAMNHRLEFYRQLQAISDQVAPYKEDLDEVIDARKLHLQDGKIALGTSKLGALKTKKRFLLHLRAESTKQTEGRTCVICTDEFENGVLTVCGHQYCKECITAWWQQHRTCPECRRHLTLVDFHEITYKPQEIRAQEEATQYPQNLSPLKSANGSGLNSPYSATTSIYDDMSSATMDEIKAIDLEGSYGTKIDTIARHLLWLREHDPGAKSIIFSQYSDFLSVLGDALNSFKIGWVSIRDTNGVEKFRKDPALECFLLDAKSDSSGLNLVNATHVFLCEPLINAAIELQAIARVHRIGQFRMTMVYMYLIEDTVEEAIYDISVGRRLAHMSGTTSAGASRNTSGRATPLLAEHVKESVLDKANSMELQQKPIGTLLVKGKHGGEIVERDDLWNCLFAGGKKGNRASGAVDERLRSEVDRHLRAEAAEARLFGGASGGAEA